MPWGACVTIEDQTEWRRLQGAEAQTARLAALGFMVAGVCHEVTNPLTSLHSIVQILRAEPDPSPALLNKGLTNIAVNVKRILDISRRLVTFSRVGEEPHARFRLDDALDEALNVLAVDHLLREIELHHERDPKAVVNGRVGQVREVFVNLLVNAIQAMRGRGSLTLPPVPAPTPRAWQSPTAARAYRARWPGGSSSRSSPPRVAPRERAWVLQSAWKSTSNTAARSRWSRAMAIAVGTRARVAACAWCATARRRNLEAQRRTTYAAVDRWETHSRPVEPVGRKAVLPAREGSASNPGGNGRYDLQPRWCANGFAASEALNDDHRVPAARTEEGRGLRVRRIRARRWIERRRLQQLTCERKTRGAAAVGQHAVVTYAVEAIGQDVQQKSTHEFASVQRHGLVSSAALGPIVLPAERHGVVAQSQQPAVGDRHPMGIARQVGQHRLRPGEWSLGVDDPFALAQWREPARERLSICQFGMRAEEPQPAIAVHSLQRLQEPAPEEPGQHAYRQEEAAAAGDADTFAFTAAQRTCSSTFAPAWLQYMRP
jgi:hypothetical protein